MEMPSQATRHVLMVKRRLAKDHSGFQASCHNTNVIVGECDMFLRNVDFQRTTRRYIPEDSPLHNYRCENLKSFITQLQPRIAAHNP
jgi:hypothetical protein